MATKNTNKTGKRPLMREGVYTIEQKKWLLSRIACNWSSPMIQEAFKELYPIQKVPCYQAISQYKTRYSIEIDQMKNDLRKRLVECDVAFVEKFQRVAEYSRHARVEQRRKRLKEQRKCMRAIAEEMGDLKIHREYNGNVETQDMTAEQHIAAIRDIIETTGITLPILTPEAS